MQVREQPDGVLPDGDRRPLHHRAGDRFVFLFSVSVCTRDLELSSDLVCFLFSCAGVGDSQEVEQWRSVHQKCFEFLAILALELNRFAQ
jgi:hypothetical protein